MASNLLLFSPDPINKLSEQQKETLAPYDAGSESSEATLLDDFVKTTNTNKIPKLTEKPNVLKSKAFYH